MFTFSVIKCEEDSSIVQRFKFLRVDNAVMERDIDKDPENLFICPQRKKESVMSLICLSVCGS